MQTAATNTPRCDHAADTGQALGLLVEESRENIYIRTQELDNALWTAHGLAASVTANSVAAPDGTTTAELVTDGSTITSTNVLQQVAGAVADSETWTCSAFVKRNSASPPSNESSALNCRVHGGTTAINPYVLIDWTTHTVAAAGSPADPADSVGIQRLGNDWYRIWVTVKNNATGNTNITTTVSPSHDASWTATPTGSIYVWGVQAEKGKFPTSYIPTTTTAVTRAADTANITNMSFFSAAAGTFVTQARVPVTSTDRQALFEVNDGTDQNYHRNYITAADVLRHKIFRSGVNQGTLSASGTVATNTTMRFGSAYASSDMTWSKDGTNQASATPANLPAPLTNVYVGRDVQGAYLNGYISQLSYWNYRLSNEAIDAKTALACENLWVAAGHTGALTTSPDGITWRSRTSSFATDDIEGVAYSKTDNLWVAVGDAGKLATSPDGVTWTQRTSSFSTSDIQAVAHDGSGLWVAVGFTGKLATSPDGITWTQRTSSFGASNIFSVLHNGAGLWLAVGAGGKIATSPDGITWTQRTGAMTQQLKGTAYGGGMWVVSGITDIQTSPDGINWTLRTSSFGGTTIRRVAHNGSDLFTAVGHAGSIATSPDGITWTQRTAGFGANDVFNAGHDGSGLWATVGNNGRLETSPDGITWTTRTSSVTAPLKTVRSACGP